MMRLPAPFRRHRGAALLASMAFTTALIPPGAAQALRGLPDSSIGFVTESAGVVTYAGVRIEVDSRYGDVYKSSSYWRGSANGAANMPLPLEELAGLAGSGEFVISPGDPIEKVVLGGARTTVGAGTATALSRDGNVIVGQLDKRPVRWVAGGSPEDLGLLPGYTSGRATAVSADGSVIVGTCSYSASYAIGSVVYSVGETAPFRWTAGGGLAPLPFPPGERSSVPIGISDDGQTVIGRASFPWRWTSAGGLVALPAGFNPIAISGDASTILGVKAGTAALWDAQRGVRELRTILSSDYGIDARHWTLREPLAISANANVIAGNGWLIRLEGSLPYPPPVLHLQKPFRTFRTYRVGGQVEVAGKAANATSVTVRFNRRTQRFRAGNNRPWGTKFVAKKGANSLVITARGPGGSTVNRIRFTAISR